MTIPLIMEIKEMSCEVGPSVEIVGFSPSALLGAGNPSILPAPPAWSNTFYKGS